MIARKKKPPKKCYRCFCWDKGILTGQERRKLKKKHPLRALGEQAQ